MTQEREQLSEDLKDRRLTISKLYEENNNLQSRVCIAQKEVSNIIKLSKGHSF